MTGGSGESGFRMRNELGWKVIWSPPMWKKGTGLRISERSPLWLKEGVKSKAGKKAWSSINKGIM